MKRKLFSSYGLFLITLLLIAGAAFPRSGSARSAHAELRAAWDRAEEIGAYHYATTIVQTSRPTPRLENVGLSSSTDRLYVEGQANRPQESLTMRIWSGQASALDTSQSLELKVEDGRALGRIGDQEWQEVDDVSTLFAPGGDALGYLASAKNVQWVGAETRAGISFTRYSFDVDGPAFARYMRDQMQAEMARRGALPQGVSLDLLNDYVGMTGSGEFWVDDAGLPLRQLVHATFPPGEWEQVEAEISTDFSQWQHSARRGMPLGMTQRQWQELLQQLGSALGVLGVSVVIVANSKSRAVYAAIALAVIASMLISPLLQAQEVHAFFQEQRAGQAEVAAAQEARQAQREAEAQLPNADFDPHADPLAQRNQSVAPAATVPFGWLVPDPAASVAYARQIVEEEELPDADGDGLPDDIEEALGTDPQDSDSDDDGLIDTAEVLAYSDPLVADTDADGLNDGVEVNELGTDPTSVDSDGDRISDPVEVRGFTDAQGRRWFLDPAETDSNGDFQADTFECPTLVDVVSNETTGQDEIFRAPSGACQDTDQDQVPDAFDADDDNDGVPDRVDDAPTTALGGGVGTCATPPAIQGGRYVPPTPIQKCIQGFADQTFELKVESFTAHKPLFVDFQLRPTDPEHLWYTLNVLDWPSGDKEGQIQRAKYSTFWSVSAPNHRSPREQNGDMRLIPMVEIASPWATITAICRSCPARRRPPRSRPASPSPPGWTRTSWPSSTSPCAGWTRAARRCRRWCRPF